MEFLKPLVAKKVLIYLAGGGLLSGKLASVGQDHIVVSCEADKKGGTSEKVAVERYVARHGVIYAEEDRGQRID